MLIKGWASKMEFPRILDEWDFNIIKELVEKNYSETELFDFKLDLQSVKKQEKIVCAFANTNGGFLIFGIGDKKETDRIIGIDPKRDFQTHFYDRIRMIEPSVYFNFKQPPIQIPDSDKIIPVCFIPQSNERPHITRKKHFYIRTSGGSNDLMNYSQIRETFYGFEQRKIKIEMLGLELTYLANISKEMIVPVEEMANRYSLHETESSILIDLMGQIYSVIRSDKKLINLLLGIRSDLGSLNQNRRSYLFQASLPMTHRKFIMRKYNENVKYLVDNLTKNIKKALNILQKKYGFEIPSKEIPKK